MNPIRDWNRFWFGPVSAKPLGLFRIVFGLVLLANLAFVAFDMDYWLTDAGLLRTSELREVAGPLRHSPLQWVRDPLSVRVFFVVSAAVTALWTVGWHTRVMGVLVYLTTLSIHHANIVTCSGADTLLAIMTFYVMLAPCGAALSLDALRESRRRGTAAEPLILPWAQRLIQLHLCWIYFNTAYLKCNGVSWLGGTALHYIMNNSEVGRPLLASLCEYPIVINLMTHAALWTEFALAFALWFRPTRKYAIVAGIGLHLGVHLTVNIPIFGEAMTACYLVFLAPDQANAIVAFLDPRKWLRREHREAAPLRIAGRIDAPSALRGPHRPRTSDQPAAYSEAEAD